MTALCNDIIINIVNQFTHLEQKVKRTRKWSLLGVTIFFNNKGSEKQMKAGDSCYFLESNRTIIKGKIKSVSGNLYTISLPSGGAIRLPKHRIYKSVEETEKSIKKNTNRNKPMVNPYDYWY